MEDKNNYIYWLGEHYETGCGSVLSIFIANKNLNDKYLKEQMKRALGDYYVDSMVMIPHEELLVYKNYIPQSVWNVIGTDGTDIVITPGAFTWFAQFHINF